MKLIGLAAGIVVFALLATTTSAQEISQADRDNAQTLYAAGVELLATANAAIQRGEDLPSLTSSNAALQIRAAFNVDQLQTIAGARVGLIQQACAPAGQAKQLYMTAGVTPGALAAGGEEAAAAVARNYLKYQDQTALGFRFDIRCMALMAPGFESYVAALSGREAQEARGGAASMRHGHWRIMDTTIKFAVGRMTSVENAELLLVELERQTGVLSRAMSADQRAQVTTSIEALDVSHLPATTRGRLDAIKLAIASAGCGPLCSA